MLLLGILLMSNFMAQTEQLSVVKGNVMDSLTKQPIPGAKVILVRADRPAASFGPQVYDTQPTTGEQNSRADRLAVVTDDIGGFRFQVEGSVKFALFAEAKGYVKMSGVGPGNVFEATPLEPKTGITLRLARELSISGRVTDRDTGKPLVGFSVAAYRYVSTGAGKMLVHNTSAPAVTGVDGRFTMQQIAPGRYYLEAQSPLRPRIEAPELNEDSRNTQRTTYARSWYPGVEQADIAMPVELVEGAPLSDVDIVTRMTKTASIRGRVLAPENSNANGEAELTLVNYERPIGGMKFDTIAKGTVKIGASYQIDRLPAASYYLFARTASPDPHVGVMPLLLGDENQDGVDLYLHAGVTLFGHVSLADRESSSDKPALPSNKMLVSLVPLIRMGMDIDPPPAAVSQEDGSFEIRGVIPDKYYVRVVRVPAGYAADEIRYERSACDGRVVRIEAKSSTQQLNIKLARSVGSIVLTVTDGVDPSPGAEVLVLPTRADKDAIDPRFELLHLQADSTGTARIGNLLPGSYHVVAYPHGASWGEDRNLWQRFESAQEVRVPATGPAIVSVRTQTAP